MPDQSKIELDERRAGSILPVGLFTASYLLVSLVLFTVTGNLEFLFYIAIIVVLAPFVWLVHRRAGLGRASLWGLSLWGLLHMAGGLVPIPEGWPLHEDGRVLYSLWLLPELVKYDHLVHALGFGVVTWVSWEALQGALAGRGGRLEASLGPAVLCAAAGMGFGALNEVLEMLAVLVLPETGVGGYWNTAWDLVANLVGCSAAAAAILVSGLRSGSSR